MTAGDDDEEAGWPHPRTASTLIGHAQAEQALLESYRSGRLSHAWLIGGPAGIGKATLAYRMARFVLAHPDPAAPAVQSAASLAVDASHPVARQVAARAHSDLLVLERGYNDSGTRRTVITVDEVRRTVSFFGSTAGQGGWRVCIVDTADELQYPQASNALLKVLEEPPRRALFLLVSHAPGRLLPTIRSRSRRLDMRALAETDVAQTVALVSGRGAAEPKLRKAAAAAEGSVARALGLLEGTALDVRDRLAPMLAKLPVTDAKALHALGDFLGDEEAFDAFLDTVQEWLSARLRTEPADPRRMARAAAAWEKIARSARDVDEYNLERKPFVFAVFGALAEAARVASQH
jgi:DNA polymerase III subunit delta'